MRSDALANQRKIVEAATRLMAERGLEAELTDIAHEAGVGVGTVYRCVGNRDQVIETIVRDAVGQMAASLDEAESREDGAENLIALVERLHTVVGKYGWVHAALIGGREEIRKEMRAVDPLRRFQALYERARSSGELRDDIESDVAAALILGSLAPWAAMTLQTRGDARAAAEAVLSPFLAQTTTATAGEAQP
ncbi:MAG: TetR/AcrR family transcriptional regulator [Dehalococcoidia bacterium]|nr:TetR/AcrR family transcriptional regulator [Dehalococcoidia bacterium]MXY72385.1 TetR/AcrR family transcriptional regulator [Dehalococcoidia bacterium]MYD28759.1 TetR/AcrR family transcriptional regulator [Dehalococcoidia bacterium]